MSTKKRPGRPSIPDSEKRRKIGVSLTRESENEAKEAAKSLGLSFSAFVEMAMREELNRRGRRLDSAREIIGFPSKPHIQAAAGSPIGAEVMDWSGENDTVMVKICGLSMEPDLHDGDIIAMRHKRVSRNPFMKKGLIYLVEYDGGYTVKRYNTRKARADEMGEEWADGGKVKILQSNNPDYPEIIIKQPLEWVAWLD